jgi:fatty-acyl-CoA synthase
VSSDDLRAFVRERLAGFKVPRVIEFGDLPKTSTGKVQKFVLRDREWAAHEKRIN